MTFTFRSLVESEVSGFLVFSHIRLGFKVMLGRGKRVPRGLERPARVRNMIKASVKYEETRNFRFYQCIDPSFVFNVSV